MRPTPLRSLALVVAAALVLSGCASRKDPTADSMTTATGLGTFGAPSGAGTGAGISDVGAGAGPAFDPVVVGGGAGVGTGTGSGFGSGDAYGTTGTLGGIDGSTLGTLGQNGTGTGTYANQGSYGANNGLVDGGIISAAPQYTDGTVYTDSTVYSDGTVYDDGSSAFDSTIQPYDSTLFDDSGSVANNGSQYTTFDNQGGGSALGGYSFPGDNGQPSYFATQVGSRILFQTDSVILSDGARETLRRQAAWLQLHPEHNVILEGHADERGTREYNLALGARRADAARAYMSSLGVVTSRLRTVSYGKERPLSTGSDPSDWAKNRRVDTALANGASF